MRGRSLRVVTWLAVSVVLGCAPAPPPSPPVTPPPIPAGFVPWPDIVWQLADLPLRPLEVTDERVEAVTTTPAAIVAVGYREIDGVRDGIVWRSADAESWKAIDDPVFDGVELVDVAPARDGFVAFGVETSSDDEDHPTAVVFLSVDGSSWERLPPLPATGDTYPTAIAGGPAGVIALAEDTGGGEAVWRSSEGRSFRRVSLGDGAAGGLVDPEPMADGFVALAADSASPTVLRSPDGLAWRSSSVDPTSNADSTAITVGRWGMIVQAMAADSAAQCPADFLAWWSMDGERWGRLPSDSPLTNGTSLAVPADDHGLLAIDGADAWSSPDGWAWRSLPEPGDGSVSIDDAVVRGDVIVAVGAEVSDDGSSLGRIVVAR